MNMLFYKQRAKIGQWIRRIGWWIDTFPDDHMTVAEKALAVEFVLCEINNAQLCTIDIRKNDGTDAGKSVSLMSCAVHAVCIGMPLSPELASAVNLPNVKPRKDFHITVLQK